MLKSISAYFDHNTEKIRELASKYKIAMIISGIFAFYNLFSLGGDDVGSTVFLLVISSIIFWASLIIKIVLQLVAKVAEKISEAIKVTDEVIEDFSYTIRTAFEEGKVFILGESEKRELLNVPFNPSSRHYEICVDTEYIHVFS